MVPRNLFYSILFIGLLLESCQGEKSPPISTSQINTTEPVMVVTNIVKPNAKPLYDKFVKDVLLKTIKTNCTHTSTQTNLTKLLATELQNPDSTWTYMLIIPRSITGSTYSVSEILKARYGLQKAIEYQSIYNSCLKYPPAVTSLMAID
jgi:hypothetical protein